MLKQLLRLTKFWMQLFSDGKSNFWSWVWSEVRFRTIISIKRWCSWSPVAYEKNKVYSISLVTKKVWLLELNFKKKRTVYNMKRPESTMNWACTAKKKIFDRFRFELSKKIKDNKKWRAFKTDSRHLKRDIFICCISPPSSSIFYAFFFF